MIALRKAAQHDCLQSKHLGIDLSEDPNHQWKVDAIGYSIQVIDLFENLTDIVGLVVPDALGQALKKLENHDDIGENSKFVLHSGLYYICRLTVLDASSRKWLRTSGYGRSC